VVPNEHFLHHEFHGPDQRPIEKPTPQILAQFEAITGIRERRYAPDDQVASDLALAAAEDALASSGTDRESLDGILVAHNFGDIPHGSHRSEQVPSLAARVKAGLGIRNPYAFAQDLLFGCPGWVQGVIQADCMIRAGAARKVLVIGAETLSRISDPHDRDSLIYADGAGAAILEGCDGDGDAGILAHAVRTDALDYSKMLSMGPSYRDGAHPGARFLKMEGRKLYRYAVSHVAGAIRTCLDRAGVTFDQVDKLLIHQANLKMDEAILAALVRLCGAPTPPPAFMPMTISWLGNSSVATVPTLLDLVRKGDLPGQSLRPGALVVFASVGAGMSINAVAYRVPSSMARQPA